MNNLTHYGRRGSLFDELFKDFTPGYLIKPLHGDPLPAQIKVDVKEDGNTYKVHAEIPGVAKDDIHVEIDGSVVTLRAEVKQEDKQTRDEQILRSERYYGTVARSFQLPAEVDENTASAKYEAGVLTLTLPKKSQATSRRLTIS